jgi:hypothetical protein
MHTLFLIEKIFKGFEVGKREYQKRHPTFKICFDTRRTNELLIHIFLKEGPNPRFDLSLRDFTDKSIAGLYIRPLSIHICTLNYVNLNNFMRTQGDVHNNFDTFGEKCWQLRHIRY